MRSGERRNTGFGAASRTRLTLAGGRQLFQSPLGIIEQPGAAPRQRQAALEAAHRLREILLLLPQLLDRSLQLGGGRLVIHLIDVCKFPPPLGEGGVGAHEAPCDLLSAGCRRISASAAIRPRMPLTNLPESGPPKVLASSIDSLMAALSGTLGRNRISKLAMRSKVRSTLAIWSRPQLLRSEEH